MNKMLDPNDILTLEFNYAKESSLCSQGDRITLVNFYLGMYAAVTTIAIGLLSSNIAAASSNLIAFLLISLGLIAIIFVLQLVRLRQAWLEAVKVMNKIKEAYISQFPQLDAAFPWKLNTIPAANKWNTISQFASLLVSVMGGSSIAVGATLLGGHPVIVVLIGMVYAVALQVMYMALLTYNK
jgi:hypothetical protein